MERIKATFYLHALGDGLAEYPDLMRKNRPIPPTDDTTMTLALLESIVGEGDYNPQRVAEKYLKLYESGELKLIGFTTYKALERFKKSKNWFYSGVIGKRSAGNGVAMRISPLGVLAYLKKQPLEDFYENVRREGYITHRNELAIGGAFAVAYAIYKNLKGSKNALETTLEVLKILEELGLENPVKENLRRALELYEKGVSYIDALNTLGTGGYIVETVGATFYLFLSEGDFIEGLKKLLEVGGDTDTIGAIFGSLYGSLRGFGAVDKTLLERLEVKGKIEKLVEALINRFP